MAVGADENFVVGPDGKEVPLAAMSPMVEPFAGPVIAVRAASAMAGWWQPGLDQVLPLQPPPSRFLSRSGSPTAWCTVVRTTRGPFWSARRPTPHMARCPPAWVRR